MYEMKNILLLAFGCVISTQVYAANTLTCPSQAEVSSDLSSHEAAWLAECNQGEASESHIGSQGYSWTVKPLIASGEKGICEKLLNPSNYYFGTPQPYSQAMHQAF